MSTVRQQIQRVFDALPPGGVITSARLHRPLNQGDPGVDRAMAQVSRKAGLKKLRNGIYWKPEFSPLLQTDLVPINAIENAMKEQYGATLHRSGQWAACQYYLAEEPDKATYDTDKRVAPLTINGFCFEFSQVRNSRLSIAGRELGELLNAIEWLLSTREVLLESTRCYLGLLLDCFSPDRLARALEECRPAVRTLCNSVASSQGSPHYITGLSALNGPLPDGEVADWHTEGMIRSGKLLVAGDNYTLAPGLEPDDLFDVSKFIEQRSLSWPTRLCAKPERAVLDIVYNAVFIRGIYPSTISLDELLVDIDRPLLKRHLQSWIPQASPHQQQHLREWMHMNEIASD